MPEAETSEKPKRSHHKKQVGKSKPKRTAEQPSLPVEGMAAKSIPEIDRAAKAYQEIKLERVAQSALEVDAKEKLHTLMNKHELKAYRVEDAVPPLIVTVAVIDEDVKVRTVKLPKGSDEE